jgi:hypothetical protein
MTQCGLRWLFALNLAFNPACAENKEHEKGQHAEGEHQDEEGEEHAVTARSR